LKLVRAEFYVKVGETGRISIPKPIRDKFVGKLCRVVIEVVEE